jgi:hypothetical protein
MNFPVSIAMFPKAIKAGVDRFQRRWRSFLGCTGRHSIGLCFGSLGHLSLDESSAELLAIIFF